MVFGGDFKELLFYPFSCFFFYLLTAKSQSSTTESKTSSCPTNKANAAAAEKSSPHSEAKSEPSARPRATSSSTSPAGPVNPKPPVPQGAKPALAARPTIPQKPRASSSRSIGMIHSLHKLSAALPGFLNHFKNNQILQRYVSCLFFHIDESSASPISSSHVSPKILPSTLKRTMSEKDKEPILQAGVSTNKSPQEGESQNQLKTFSFKQ